MKRGIALALSLALVLGLALVGCGGDTSSTGQSNGASQSGGTSTSTSGSTGEDGGGMDMFHRYDETITLTVGQWISDEKYFPEGMDSADNAMYDMVKELMNIQLEPAFTTPKTEAFYEQSARLQMADNLPDICAYNINTFYDGIKAEQFVDLKPYYDELASPTLKRMLEVNSGAFMEPCYVDGALYALPYVVDQFNLVPMMWVRTDWLEITGWKNAKGGDYPETYEDFTDMLQTFADNYDKIEAETGVADVYAFAMYQTMGNPLSGMMAAFDAYPGIHLTDASGNYYNGSLTPEVKACLEELNRFQTAGILRTDWATQPTEQIVADSQAGKVGVFFDEFWAALAGQVGGMMWLAIAEAEANPGLANAGWVSLPIPRQDGSGLIKPQVTRQSTDYYAVSRNCENPEALIIMLNHLAEGSNEEGTAKGPEGGEGYYAPYPTKYRELDETYPEKSIWTWLPVALDDPTKNATYTTKFHDIEAGKMSEDELTPSELIVWNNVNSEDPFTQWQWRNVYMDNGVPTAMLYTEYTSNKYVGAPTATSQRNGQTLLTTQNTAFVNFITGSDSLDNFDAFVENYNSLGGTAIVQEIEEVMKDR